MCIACLIYFVGVRSVVKRIFTCIKVNKTIHIEVALEEQRGASPPLTPTGVALPREWVKELSQLVIVRDHPASPSSRWGKDSGGIWGAKGEWFGGG